MSDICCVCRDEDSEGPCQIITKMVHGRTIQWNHDTGDSGDETEDYDTPGTSGGKQKQVGSLYN